MAVGGRGGKLKGRGDCLSELLPDDLLVHILSFLDLPDAVRTGVLSKRWRHLWALCPSIKFSHEQLKFVDEYASDSEIIHLGVSEVITSLVSEVITRVLAQHNRLASVLSFYVDLFYDDSLIPYLDSCVDFAIDHRVRHLTLSMYSAFNDYVVPPRFFQCSNFLTQLQLVACAIKLPEAPFCLSSLKTMHISYSLLEVELLERLTSSACCPALESLQLAECNSLGPITFTISLTNPTLRHLCLRDMSATIPVIRAPHLKHLELSGEHGSGGFVLKDVSSLTEATIDFDPSRMWVEDLCFLNSLFSCYPPIKLNVCLWVLKVFSLCEVRGVVAVPLAVKHLNLRTWPRFINIIPGLALLFRSSPDIEHLSINLCPKNCYCIEVETDWIFSNEVNHNISVVGEEYWLLLEQSLQFSNIRTIQLDDFYWTCRENNGFDNCSSADHVMHRRWQFEFVRIMLAKLKKLKNMIIRSNSNQHGLSYRMAECLSLPRASREAVIEFEICA